MSRAHANNVRASNEPRMPHGCCTLTLRYRWYCCGGGNGGGGDGGGCCLRHCRWRCTLLFYFIFGFYCLMRSFAHFGCRFMFSWRKKLRVRWQNMYIYIYMVYVCKPKATASTKRKWNRIECFCCLLTPAKMFIFNFSSRGIAPHTAITFKYLIYSTVI